MPCTTVSNRSNLVIYFFQLRITIGADTQREVNRIFVHPDFDYGKESSNIALLHLSPIPPPAAAVANPPVTTNTAIEGLTPYQKCTLVGWTSSADGAIVAGPVKRKLDITVESSNITSLFDVDSTNCKPELGAALICNGMFNGFLSVACPSTVNYVDVTPYNMWIDQIWRCELKPEIGGCQANSKPAVMAVAENINIGGASESATVEYNEQMDRGIHDVLITTMDAAHGVNGPTPAPEPAPEPVGNDMGEVGHVYHDHHGDRHNVDDDHDNHDNIHDHYEQNSRTHENYEQDPHNHENFERPSQEQQGGRAPATSGAVTIFQSIIFLVGAIMTSILFITSPRVSY